MKNIVLLLTALLISANSIAKGEKNDTILEKSQYLEESDYAKLMNEWFCGKDRTDHLKRLIKIGADKDVMDTMTYSYDKKGRLKEVLISESIEGNVARTKETFFYSFDKKTDESTCEYYQGGKLINKEWINKNGYRTRLADWKSAIIHSAEYLSGNRIAKIEEPNINTLTKFTYLPNGECVEQQYTTEKNQKPTLKKTTKFDKHGFIYYQSTTEQTIDQTKDKFTYTYYPNGKVKSRENRKEKCLYDENGNCVSDSYFDENGKELYKESYQYNENGQVTEYKKDTYGEKIEYTNGTKSKRTIYEDGKIEEVITYDSHGNKIQSSKDKAKYQYEYYE